MKKYYKTLIYSCILFCWSLQAFAQTYHPLLDSVSNHWTFICNVIPVRVHQPLVICDYNFLPFTAMGLSTAGDTLMGTETYKKLHLDEVFGSGNSCDFGYIREDTTAQRVYFVDNVFSPEILIYDFSMLPGDSINLNFVSTWGTYYSNGYYHLDSIGSIQLNTGLRRIFYLSNPNSLQQYPLEWIESVGHPGHLVYPYSVNFFGGVMFWCNDPIARDFYQMLTCFEHNSQKVYFDSCAHAFALNNACFDYTDSCNFWNICGSLDESSSIRDWHIAPNPTNGPVRITLDAVKRAELRFLIRDIRGALVFEESHVVVAGINQFDLAVSNYISGVYIVEVEQESGSMYKKLIWSQ